jgi:hypothetical protein
MGDSDTLILQWANQVLAHYADDRVRKVAERTLALTASSLRAAITPEDKDGFIFAGQAYDGGKWQPGTLMVLPDRVHYSWSTGVFRPKEHTLRVDFPPDASVLVDEGSVRETRLSMPMRKIRIDGTPGGHVFGICALDGWEPSLKFAQGLTEGWLSFQGYRATKRSRRRTETRKGLEVPRQLAAAASTYRIRRVSLSVTDPCYPGLGCVRRASRR